LKRNFWVHLSLLAFVIFLGLISRKFSGIFPTEIQKYPGSSLWALAVFVAIGLVCRTSTTQRVAVYALLISVVVEFSQLLNIAWLNEVRGTRLGHLFLGSTFNSPDLLAYVLGILVGLGLEIAFFRKNLKIGTQA
jgi:Protein of unknown function (DUF2809)